MKNDQYFLEAIRMAESVKGKTSPNPAVGCVIVKNGNIIAEGSTQKAGFDHAEIVTLKKAGKEANGATMYVTLEPCVEYPGKKTPSCAKKIIEAGISEIFIGMKDLNPNVNGKGIAQLENAGVRVHLLEGYNHEVRMLNEDFFKYIQTGVPFVYAKAAMTLDGNIASSDGSSKWISGEESRIWVHKLRNRVDVIMVGVGTVLADNPELSVRISGKIKDPLRVIIDPDGRTPVDSNVFKGPAKTIFIVRKGIAESFKNICITHEKEFIEFPSDENGIINIRDVIHYLGKEKGIESILIEGGGKIFYHALHSNAIDKLILFLAPKILGGRGIPLFNGETNLQMKDAIKLKEISVENIGEDTIIQGYL